MIIYFNPPFFTRSSHKNWKGIPETNYHFDKSYPYKKYLITTKLSYFIAEWKLKKTKILNHLIQF